MFKKIFAFLNMMGPGLMMACASIGTSHFIQSTRAGGYFGYDLIFFIIMINILKYPFIEFGARYTAATGENIINAYYRYLNKKIFYIFFLLIAISNIATVTLLSYLAAAIFKVIFNIDFLEIKYLVILIMLLSFFILIIGRYNMFDFITKIFIVFLTISTVLVAIFSFTDIDYNINSSFYNDSPFSLINIGFLLALAGWMPAPIEMSIWNSIWIEEKRNNLSSANISKFNFNKIKFDFNVGYILTIITAILFLLIGANMFYFKSIKIEESAIAFIEILIRSYNNILGSEFNILISISIFTAIFSTFLAVIEVVPKIMSISTKLIMEKKFDNYKLPGNKIYFIYMILLMTISSLIIILFINNFTIMVDFVTIFAFISAPIFAYINYKIIFTNNIINQKYRPSKYIRYLCYIGFIYFALFLTLYIIESISSLI